MDAVEFAVAYESDPAYGEVVVAVEEVFQLREKLLSLLREAVYLAMFTGVPFARPMWYGAPCNELALSVEDQYMVGDRVVIAPIVTPNTTSRWVFLPIDCGFLVKHMWMVMITLAVKIVKIAESL